MQENQFNFREGKIDENGYRLEVQFEGIFKNENIDLDKINSRLNKFMNNSAHHGPMLNNVTSIRTILKDFQEKWLIVSFSNPDVGKEIVKYENGNLLFYEQIVKSSTKGKIQTSIKYNAGNSLDISFGDEENNIVDYPKLRDVANHYSDILKKLEQLKHVKVTELNRDAKKLIEIYKLFYNENPDFMADDISIKTQAMMSILEEFGISLGEEYSFITWHTGKRPLSLNLERLVYNLYPLGEITSVGDLFKIASEAKRTIKVVGEQVRMAMNDKYSNKEILIMISKVLYARRSCLPTSTSVQELSTFTNYSPDEIETSLRLVRNVENKLDNFCD